MNYKTYAEAKIANPDSEIVTTGKSWKWAKHAIGTFLACNSGIKGSDSQDNWVICNPADHCSSLKEFLDTGFELVCGDKIQTSKKSIFTITDNNSGFNNKDGSSNEVFILSASALNGGCKIPFKKMTFVNCQELKIGECIGVVIKSNPEWTVYNNTMPLCELTDEQVGKLVKHSDCVEHMNPNSGEWGATITPMWSRVGVYRIKPKSERELFIEATTKVMRDAGTKCPDNHEYFGIMFDAGARYKDLTQHFGENI